MCADCGAEGSASAGAVFCPCPPVWEALVRIHHIQEKTTPSCESVQWNFINFN